MSTIIILAIIAFVTFFNLIILKIKYEKERYGDLTLDIASIVILNMFFGGTLGGMMIAMMASFGISVYLYFSPPKFNM